MATGTRTSAPRRRIFIVGPSGSGKSLFACYLAQALRTGWSECSDVLVSRLARLQVASPLGMVIAECNRLEKWEAYIRACKERFRPQLRELGEQFCELDAAYLLRASLRPEACEHRPEGVSREEAAAGPLIVVGARRASEFLALYGGIAVPAFTDTWVFVSRAELARDTHFEDEFFDRFAWSIHNDGGSDELHERAVRFARTFASADGGAE